ncbi:MAG TPA: GGDEF domain-containing protein [Acidimicrobiales bacterium]|nr:GGDEF domain-containing protein [Acidimicrobiales bacterium]
MTPSARGPGGEVAADGVVDIGDMPPTVATQVLRAIDRSPSTVVTLVDPDLNIRWMSASAAWVSGSDPAVRQGASSIDRIHPEDAERIVHGLEQLRLATTADATAAAMPEPIRYRWRRLDGRWMIMEATIHNLLADPVVNGFLVFARPVTGELDGAGYVLDLLASDRPVREVLAACAALVPDYIGSAAAVAFLPDDTIIGVPAGSPVAEFAAITQWWNSVRRGDASLLHDFDGVDPSLAALARKAGFRSFWALPIWDQVDRQVIGCLAVWVRLTIEPAIGIEEPLRNSRRLAGLVISEERRRDSLHRLAETDPLTGLANRSALSRRLEHEAGPVTLALVDLDDFKPVNDNYGHDIGDAVLRIVAARLRGTLRSGDLAVRFGGDEFAIVFAEGTGYDDAQETMRRVVHAVEAPIATAEELIITVGASVGLATAAPDDVQRLADQALYDAKRLGR